MTAPELPSVEPLHVAPEPAPTLADRLAPGLDRETLVVVVSTLFALLISHYEGSTGWFDGHLRARFTHTAAHLLPVYAHLWWFGTAVVLYVALPCLAAGLAGAPKLSTLGMGPGDWRFGVKLSAALVAVMLPVVALAAQTGDFIHQYPMASESLHGWGLFATYELAYVAYFFAWEFLFRGFMLFGLARRVGPGLAIALQTVPFALMHMGKPELECYGSVVAGLALGILAWRTRSFWYGFAVHALVAVAMDVFAGRHHPGVLNMF